MPTIVTIAATGYMINYLISIVGPTAIGKTALSIKVAEHFNTEIISADSRQFYKEMEIGTAVPSTDELATVKHHFIQHRSISEPYSVGQFGRDTMDRLDELFNEHPLVVMVGGSGLYLKAVTEGLNDFPEIDPKIRAELNKQLKSVGLESLQNKLKELDPEGFEMIATDNPHRVIRALEICIGTGKPYSSFIKPEVKSRPFKVITIGLKASRELLYDRINRRVELMLEQGLLNEVQALYPFKHLNALNTVGYKELFKYIDGECDYNFAVSEIKKNTRRFAKRQLTWFRKDESIHWFEFDESADKIIDFIREQIKKPA